MLDEALVKQAIAEIPSAVEATIAQDAKIKTLAAHFIQRDHALFLGRGVYCLYTHLTLPTMQ